MDGQDFANGPIQISDSNIYLALDGVLIFCPIGGCGGGGMRAPTFYQDQFFGKILAKFDENLRSLIKRYVGLGLMREQYQVRARGFGTLQEEIDAELKAMGEFFDKEEAQYVAAGFAPISFDGYPQSDKEEFQNYENLLLERVAVPV